MANQNGTSQSAVAPHSLFDFTRAVNGRERKKGWLEDSLPGVMVHVQLGASYSAGLQDISRQRLGSRRADAHLDSVGWNGDAPPEAGFPRSFALGVLQGGDRTANEVLPTSPLLSSRMPRVRGRPERMWMAQVPPIAQSCTNV